MNTVAFLGGLALACCVGMTVAYYPQVAPVGYGGYQYGSTGVSSGGMFGGGSSGGGFGGIGGLLNLIITVVVFMLIINLLTGSLGGITGSGSGLSLGGGSRRSDRSHSYDDGYDY
ncbi:hypothetical protein ACF0H5_011645 [Mactra antiquata]